ncbi:hypothetical protein MUP95_07705 [bacterium]|nr:hypothetical protein [bacterium]
MAKKLNLILLFGFSFLTCDHLLSPFVTEDDFDVFENGRPEVRISENNYDDISIMIFWEPSINGIAWRDFSHIFNTMYTKTLRDKFILEMKKQVAALGEDDAIFEACLFTPNLINNDRVVLPCLAEKARFDNHEVWIIVFMWGFDALDLGHIKIYAVDIATFEILFYATCT